MGLDQFLRFLEDKELWFYIIAGGLAFVFVRRMLLAWSDLRNAIFGLEKDIANRKFISAMTVVVLLILVTGAEFIVVSFITPSLPDLKPLATATISLDSTGEVIALQQNGTQIAPESTPEPGGTPVATADGCLPGQIEWISPSPGEKISGSVTLEGTVNPTNFGFYKYEFQQTGSDTWTTIAAGNATHVEGELGTWNTSEMPQGDYNLRLVVVDNENNPYPACELPVTIVAP